MNVDIVCSSTNHPIFPRLLEWKTKNQPKNNINIVNSTDQLKDGGEILFLISCSEILTKELIEKYKYALLIHASDLPRGRGWSPHIWQILEGNTNITVSLLEVAEGVDTGRIWKKKSFHVESTDLFDEINDKLFKTELMLMDFAMSNIHSIEPKKQSLDIPPTYYRKRTSDDSQLDIDKSIRENFNLLRICDTERYPAFFWIDGVKYKVSIQKDE